MAGVIINRAPERQAGILEQMAGLLAGNLINGMFERDANARNYKMQTRMAEEEAARQEQAKVSDYGRMQEQEANRIAAINGWNYDMANPLDRYKMQNVSSQYGYQNVPQMMIAASPHKQFANVNLGDRNMTQVQDPLSGAIESTMQAYGISPTSMMEERGRNARAYAAQRGPGQQLVQDSNGQYVYISPDGSTPTNITGPLKSPGNTGPDPQAINALVKAAGSDRDSVGNPIPENTEVAAAARGLLNQMFNGIPQQAPAQGAAEQAAQTVADGGVPSQQVPQTVQVTRSEALAAVKQSGASFSDLAAQGATWPGMEGDLARERSNPRKYNMSMTR